LKDIAAIDSAKRCSNLTGFKEPLLAYQDFKHSSSSTGFEGHRGHRLSEALLKPYWL
jgi:hypothetical protein